MTVTNPSPTSLPYYKHEEFTIDLRGQTICVHSKPGIPHWNQLTPDAILLSEAAQLRTDEHALILGCGYGASGVALARLIPCGQLYLSDIDYISLKMSEQTLNANDIANARILAYGKPSPFQRGTLDAIFMTLPKGRKLARRWLLEAHFALKKNGLFYIAGSNKTGIQSIIKDAETLFAEASILGYKKGNRVCRFTKKALYPSTLPVWAHEPGIAIDSWVEFQIEAREQSFQIRSLPGIFSNNRLDPGTQLLLENLTIPKGARVLDVGCGYGIIGMWAACQGASKIDMVDNNLLAIIATNENIALNDITNAQAFPSDVLDSPDITCYTHILSNPPFHSGKDVDYHAAHAMIAHAFQVLEPQGQLIIVANKFIRYYRVMKQVFGNVEISLETGSYHMLVSHKSV